MVQQGNAWADHGGSGGGVLHEAVEGRGIGPTTNGGRDFQAGLEDSQLLKLIQVTLESSIPSLKSWATFAVNGAGFIGVGPGVIELALSGAGVPETVVDTVNLVDGDLADVETSGIDLPVAEIDTHLVWAWTARGGGGGGCGGGGGSRCGGGGGGRCGGGGRGGFGGGGGGRGGGGRGCGGGGGAAWHYISARGLKDCGRVSGLAEDCLSSQEEEQEEDKLNLMGHWKTIGFLLFGGGMKGIYRRREMRYEKLGIRCEKIGVWF